MPSKTYLFPCDFFLQLFVQHVNQSKLNPWARYTPKGSYKGYMLPGVSIRWGRTPVFKSDDEGGILSLGIHLHTFPGNELTGGFFTLLLFSQKFQPVSGPKYHSFPFCLRGQLPPNGTKHSQNLGGFMPRLETQSIKLWVSLPILFPLQEGHEGEIWGDWNFWTWLITWGKGSSLLSPLFFQHFFFKVLTLLWNEKAKVSPAKNKNSFESFVETLYLQKF